MIEYAIFIVMVIVTIGFTWLWLTETEKGKRKEALGKRRLSDDEVIAARPRHIVVVDFEAITSSSPRA